MRNHEITEQGPLLNEEGNLREPGWARHLLLSYDRADIKAPKFRIKEWDYYLVLGKDFGAAFTLSDDGYIGLQSVSLLKLGDEPYHGRHQQYPRIYASEYGNEASFRFRKRHHGVQGQAPAHAVSGAGGWQPPSAMCL